MTLEHILGSITCQLIQEDEEALPVLVSLYQSHKLQNTSPSTSELLDAIRCVLQLRKKNFLIVDALDECTEDVRWDLIELLKNMESDVQILLTSRFSDNISEDLDHPETLEIKAHRSDLELYVDRQILKNRNLRKLVEKSPSLRQDIKSAVVATAENM